MRRFPSCRDIEAYRRAAAGARPRRRAMKGWRLVAFQSCAAISTDPLRQSCSRFYADQMRSQSVSAREPANLRRQAKSGNSDSRPLTRLVTNLSREMFRRETRQVGAILPRRHRNSSYVFSAQTSSISLRIKAKWTGAQPSRLLPWLEVRTGKRGRLRSSPGLARSRY